MLNITALLSEQNRLDTGRKYIYCQNWLALAKSMLMSLQIECGRLLWSWWKRVGLPQYQTDAGCTAVQHKRLG